MPETCNCQGGNLAKWNRSPGGTVWQPGAAPPDVLNNLHQQSCMITSLTPWVPKYGNYRLSVVFAWVPKYGNYRPHMKFQISLPLLQHRKFHVCTCILSILIFQSKMGKNR
jgi:hypothetical protein